MASRGRDIDETHAERFHERKLAEALGERETPDKPERAAPRPEAPRPETTAGHLAFASGHRRATHERAPEVDVEPSLQEMAAAMLGDEDGGEDPFPSAPTAGLDLPETELRPPAFLRPLEAMKDIYMRVRGRMSRKTQALLEGTDLEDLLDVARPLPHEESPKRRAEGRLAAKLLVHLQDDPGPLLVGLHDPRLAEPWRLFIDGWDIWTPDGREDGVELFWEGEAEDDDGEPLELLQTLSFVEGELTLSTRIGELEDELVFDGEDFFRLDTARPLPREPDR